MDMEREIQDIAASSSPEISQKLLEYIQLRHRFIELTGIAEPNESFLFDILQIEDDKNKREAARTAKRMRRLAREAFSQLKG